MATVTEAQAGHCRQVLHADYGDLLAAMSPPLTKAQIKAVYQAIEDYWETNRLSLKAAMDTAAGATLTNNLAKKIGRVWMRDKWESE